MKCVSFTLVNCKLLLHLSDFLYFLEQKNSVEPAVFNVVRFCQLFDSCRPTKSYKFLNSPKICQDT